MSVDLRHTELGLCKMAIRRPRKYFSSVIFQKSSQAKSSRFNASKPVVSSFRGRRGGRMLGQLARSSDRVVVLAFLGKTLYSQGATLYPGV